MSERATYLHMAQLFDLRLACAPIVKGFGTHVYLVGSCLTRADYRDVDVRLILADERFATLIPDEVPQPWAPRQAILNRALSEWLCARTGLPIDFQFQQRTAANLAWPNERRHPLGVDYDTGRLPQQQEGRDDGK